MEPTLKETTKEQWDRLPSLLKFEPWVLSYECFLGSKQFALLEWFSKVPTHELWKFFTFDALRHKKLQTRDTEQVFI